MRKGQRFTHARLQRWCASGRGVGTGADYQPWHQVTRDDPSSRGRSHLVNWRFGRLHHFLSDQELVAFGFATMLPDVVDLREQYPLALEEHAPDVAAYRISAKGSAPGTLQIARDAGYLHPVVREVGAQYPWVMSTDLVVTMSDRSGMPMLLALCVKASNELKNPRKQQLLHIEREYWRLQSVPWLLLTPELYDRLVGDAIRAGMSWALGQGTASAAHIEACAALAPRASGLSQQRLHHLIADTLNVDLWLAQTVMWQAVWCGQLPLDLRRPLRPNQPIQILAADAFWQQNPIASRRTAWI